MGKLKILGLLTYQNLVWGLKKEIRL